MDVFFFKNYYVIVIYIYENYTNLFVFKVMKELSTYVNKDLLTNKLLVEVIVVSSHKGENTSLNIKKHTCGKDLTFNALDSKGVSLKTNATLFGSRK